MDYANGAADLPTSGHEIKRLNRGRGNLRVDCFFTFKGDSFTGVGQRDWGAGPVQDEWAAVEQDQRSVDLFEGGERSTGLYIGDADPPIPVGICGRDRRVNAPVSRQGSGHAIAVFPWLGLYIGECEVMNRMARAGIAWSVSVPTRLAQ